MHFKSGYILDSVATIVTDFKNSLKRNELKDKIKLNQIDGLLEHVSSFDVDFHYDFKPDFKDINPVLATLNNIVTRGLPTRAPVILENIFSEIGLIAPNVDEYELIYPILKRNISYETIFELLHIVEPQLQITQEQYGGFPGSLSEWRFLNDTLEDFPFTKQILQSQRDSSTIGNGLAGGRNLDFSLELPYLITNNLTGLNSNERKGIIFEFDGPQHQLKSVKHYDNYRDEVAEENNFDTLRQSHTEIGLNRNIKYLLESDIFKVFKNNFNRKSEEYLSEFSLLFIPFAVARIQKTIIEFLLVHLDLFKKKKISIAIIERDLPCGAIAIKSLEELFFNVNSILEKEDKFLPMF